MPARITGAARFIKNTNPKPILEGKGALVYTLELHDLGVAGLPECVRLEHVGGVGDLDPITGLVVLIIQLNVKVAGRNDVVCARYGIRKPGKRSAEKHGKAEHERKNAQYQLLRPCIIDLARAFFNAILENSKGESSRTPTENKKSAPRGCAFLIGAVHLNRGI